MKTLHRERAGSYCLCLSCPLVTSRRFAALRDHLGRPRQWPDRYRPERMQPCRNGLSPLAPPLVQRRFPNPRPLGASCSPGRRYGDRQAKMQLPKRLLPRSRRLGNSAPDAVVINTHPSLPAASGNQCTICCDCQTRRLSLPIHFDSPLELSGSRDSIRLAYRNGAYGHR